MNNNIPIETRTNKSSNFVLQTAIVAIVIVLLFSIFQSVAYKKVSFNALNISIMTGLWVLFFVLEIRRRKSIFIYPGYVVIKSKHGHEKKFNCRDIYLKIVTHPAQSLKSTRTLQLRTKNNHRIIFSIEPLNRKDDSYLEEILIKTCNIKVDNWDE